MADINYVVGTNGDDVLTPTDGINDYLGMGGNDTIDGSTGVNTIHYNSGDGVDTVKFELPRSYQFGDFLTAAQNGLEELSSLADKEVGASPYSNSYFASADSSLLGMLPPDLAASIGAFQETYVPGVGYVPGTLDPTVAQAAFTSLINWIGTSSSNVIQFGPGITLSNLNLQLGAMADLGTPQSTPTQFAVALGGEQGVVFNLNGPAVVAGNSSSPPVIDLTFQFADGTSATLADLMARPNPGVMGTQNGSDDSELLSGSLGSDMIFANGGNDRIDGSAGDDYLFGGNGDDVISGGSGYDNVFGEDGNDIMAAGKGGDPLTGTPPDFLSGGAGNDVYTFNRGDGGERGVTIDNADPDGSGIDTISFGKNVSRADLVASVDPSSGNLVLGISGTTDQITINWFDVYSGLAPRADQVIDRVQFIDADGTAHVYDLASLVQAAFPNPSAANPSDSVQLVGANAAELPVEAAGGEAAVRYALTGSLLASNGNQAPTAAVVADMTVLQDAPDFSYTLPAGTFADPEGAALTLNATTANGQALPSWLSFDPVHGTFSGTPTNDDVGHVAVKVTATDPGGLSVSQTFNLNVENVNDAPTATVGVLHVPFAEDQSLGYTLPNDTFSDVDGDVLTYGATLEDGSALPSWLHFNEIDRSLAGTPTNDDVGNLSVKVTATDPSGASVSKSVSIDIANTNDAPTASAGVAVGAATEDASFTYGLPAGTFTDVDAGDVLTYGAKMADGSALPSWLQIDAASGTLSGTPTNDDVGSLSVVVTATDRANTSATKSISISVANTNDAPTASAGVAAAAATEDASFTYDLPAGTFTDVDAGDVLTYGAKMADGSALPSWLQVDAASGTLHGTPANADVGSLSVVVTATDRANTSATKSVSISVANTNDAPTATAGVAAATATEDASFTYNLPAGTFTEVDAGDVLTYGAKMADGSALPSWLQIDAASGTLHGTPANGDVGSLSVVVTATDRANTSATKSISISVANTNDAPTATAGVATATATEDASFTYTLPAGTFVDVNAGDVLTYGAKMADGSALPSWLQIDAASGTLHGTPANGDVGSLSVVVTATDRANTSASKTLSIGVANTNDAPTVAHAVADQAAVAGSPFSMAVPSNTFQDVDANDALTLSARLANGDALPSWLHFDAVNRTLSGTASAAGQWNIALVATDLAGVSVADAFTLNVDAPATPPTSTGKIINGTPGNDKLYGTAGNDQINGAKGKDLLSGGGGDDALFVSADAKWASGSTRTNAVSGEKVSISGKVRSYDVFDGGTGSDTLVGTSGNDAILLDDSKSSAPQKGARIVGVEKIDAGAGDDVVNLTSKRYSYGNVEIDGGSGNDVLWSSSGKDVLRGGSGNDSLDGGAGNDYLEGGSGNDKLNGGSGVDILQGGSGKDTLKDTSGNGVLDGGSGNDSLTEGSGNSMLIGGQGSDHLTLGGGYDVIAFNRGDGRDVVSSDKGGKSTLSLGGGISYQDLTLSRSGSDLILNIGSSDRITFEKWYDGRKYQAVSKLQVVAEAMPGFDEVGGDALHNDKIETFDFKGLVKAFDTARSHSPGLSKWTLTNALAQFHLGGSDSAALGGDLAYQYGVNGTLVGIAANVAQDTAGSSQFGKQAQSLHSQTELKDGLVKLS